jgi:hypothetical protein
MKLHFRWPDVARALDEVRAATVVRPLYEQVTGKGLWLVGDEGVYLMPNTEGEIRTIVYAKECNPTKSEDWWTIKRATFGGDDGVEFISIEELDRLVAIPPKPRVRPHHLSIDMTPEQFVLSVVWSSKSAKRDAI